jgi:hypothetical protein
MLLSFLAISSVSQIYASVLMVSDKAPSKGSRILNFTEM